MKVNNLQTALQLKERLEAIEYAKESIWKANHLSIGGVSSSSLIRDIASQEKVLAMVNNTRDAYVRAFGR